MGEIISLILAQRGSDQTAPIGLNPIGFIFLRIMSSIAAKKKRKTLGVVLLRTGFFGIYQFSSPIHPKLSF